MGRKKTGLDFGERASAPGRVPSYPVPGWRRGLLLALFISMPLVLVARAVDLQVLDNAFLQAQGDARHLRTVPIAANRGLIRDRDGEPLAISTPVRSLWAHPPTLLGAADRLPELARALELEPEEIASRLDSRTGSEFMYLRRQLSPEAAGAVLALGIPGVHALEEYRRYYPAGEVGAHLLGFTDVDDAGLEGLELAYDRWLQGVPGEQRVVRDRLGRVIADPERLREPVPGQDLMLSIDRTLQYVAHRELAAAVERHEAKGGSLVLMDSRTGEVLALANQPVFNPNARNAAPVAFRRNRAMTDVYEPGSTIKPFTIAAALEHGTVSHDTVFATGHGVMRVGRHTVQDIRGYGDLDLVGVMRKSSNVAVASIALGLPEESLWSLLQRVGLGTSTETGFPGEAAGHLALAPPRDDLSRATLSFGYGLAATPLQLARAYTVFANDGLLVNPTLLRQDAPADALPVLDPTVARDIRQMMESVVGPGGTGRRAAIPGYRVAGKTGTSRKAVAGGYDEDRYSAWFAGMAPAGDPRLLMVVMIDEPMVDGRYGGEVAAPVFANVMAAALRLGNVPPDRTPTDAATWTAYGAGSQ